ncbi:hypothetical protein HPB48_003254 [Haemaphysalis longicornis]|uniref:Uncharacterized protein n=1 Tax=Haemaphysalis longicornis TaxID=44386 RepID=A0A9J6H2P5_HAELO|nr:hypothetical protein HPB48_003254 [Haemaphysalis longicornis]
MGPLAALRRFPLDDRIPCRAAWDVLVLFHLSSGEPPSTHDWHDTYRARYTTAVIDAYGVTKTAASIKCHRKEKTEEVAVAVTLVDRDCSTVVSDSRQDIRSYATEEVSPTVTRILERADLRFKERLLWFPAQEGNVSDKHESRNESAQRNGARTFSPSRRQRGRRRKTLVEPEGHKGHLQRDHEGVPTDLKEATPAQRRAG